MCPAPWLGIWEYTFLGRRVRSVLVQSARGAVAATQDDVNPFEHLLRRVDTPGWHALQDPLRCGAVGSVLRRRQVVREIRQTASSAVTLLLCSTEGPHPI